ncbi:hypothetical protein, partial [Flavonifractor plautii]|uniref:hypothetical protein n=1 Tax=Flavonifractor plautii TaxID=292800 RepID=UPI001A9C02A2
TCSTRFLGAFENFFTFCYAYLLTFADLFAFSGAERKIPVDKSVTARYNNLAVFRDDNMRMCWNW